MKLIIMALLTVAAVIFFLLKSGEESFEPPPPNPSAVNLPQNTVDKPEDQGSPLPPSGDLYRSPLWEEYSTKYLGRSPLEAMSKSFHSSLVASQKNIESVLNGGSKVRWDPPVYSGERPVERIDLAESSTALRFEVHNQLDIQELEEGRRARSEVLAEESRFTKMRDFMRELIVQRQSDELVILFVGMTHSLDLFFGGFMNPYPRRDDPVHRIRDEVVYLALPLTPDTLFYSKDYIRFLSAYRGTRISHPTVKAASFNLQEGFLGRLYYFNSLRNRFTTYDELIKPERPGPAGVIVIMDIHDTQVPQVFRDMPSAADLSEAGFTSVTWAMEGWQYGKEYQSSDFEVFHTLKEDQIFIGKRADDDRNFYKKFRPLAYRLLKESVLVSETTAAMHEKIREWQAGGIKIRLTGLEEFDRFDRERIVKSLEDD